MEVHVTGAAATATESNMQFVRYGVVCCCEVVRRGLCVWGGVWRIGVCCFIFCLLFGFRTRGFRSFVGEKGARCEEGDAGVVCSHDALMNMKTFSLSLFLLPAFKGAGPKCRKTNGRTYIHLQ